MSCRLIETLDGFYCLECSRVFRRVPERCPERRGTPFFSAPSVTNCSAGDNAPNPATTETYGTTPPGEPPPAAVSIPDPEPVETYGYDPFDLWGDLTPELRHRLRSLPHLKRAYERRTGRMLGRTRRHSLNSITHGKEVWVCLTKNPSHGLHYFRLYWGDGSTRLGYRDIPGGNCTNKLVQERAAAVRGWIAEKLDLEEILRRIDRMGF